MLCAVSHQPDRRIPRMGYGTVAACTGRVLKQKNNKTLPVENARVPTLNLKVHSESREYRVIRRTDDDLSENYLFSVC